jgi:hypothetical protein
VALGWRHLVADFLAAGTLIPLFSEQVEGPGAFWLTPTKPVIEGSPVARLREWLISVAEETSEY